jgi:soluble lytic murein transglycosylase-like protein
VGALKLLAPALLLIVTSPVRANDVVRWRLYIDEASTRFGVPSSWIERVMRAESNGATTLHGAPIRSRAGAMGLMQLMPSTWAGLRARFGLGEDPDDPHDNILAGTFYLRLMYDRFGYPGLFGAYNAGPGAYAGWLAGKRRLPGETAAYVTAVGGATRPTDIAKMVSAPPNLFVVRRETETNSAGPRDLEEPNSLFAVRRPIP